MATGGIVMTEPLTQQTLLDELVAQNRLQPEAKAVIADALMDQEPETPNPWFVTALIAVSAWLAVIPFIGFLFILGIVDSLGSIMVVGFLLIVGTVFWHRLNSTGLFIEQLLLALNFTGQALFLVGIGLDKDVITAALTAWFLEIVLISVYQDHILRFIAVLIATMAALVLLERFDIPEGIHVLIVLLAIGATWYWIAEPRHLTDQMMKSLYQPLGYGFIVALQLVLLLSILPTSRWVPPVSWAYSSFGLAMLLLILEYYLMRINQVMISSPSNSIILGCTSLIALLLYQSPGIIASVIVLLLGFQRGNRVLIGLALVFLTVFLTAFYYYLNITLLSKSVALITTGITLLILRLVLKSLFPPHEGGS
jgi:hypothetical protein